MQPHTKPYEPLYLKKRPGSLKDLVGQESVTRTLANAINNERWSHAYLFTGPRGTGKTSTARILAKSLNCQKGPTPEPCLECTPCHEITLGKSTAVFEIDAASHNSVDDARELIERAPLVAAGGRFKLYIIDECHMLTKDAFNALLKTIEEPPDKVIFVLATTEEHKVPKTIASRCQRLMFRLIEQSVLADYLKKVAGDEEISIADDAIDVLARRAGGGLRDALGLLDQASLLGSADQPVTVSELLSLVGAVEEDVLLEISRWVGERNGQEALAVVNRLLMDGREPHIITTELAQHFVNLAKASYFGNDSGSEGVSQSIMGSPDYLTGVIEQAQHFDQSELSQIIAELDRVGIQLKRSSQPVLTLEIGLLALCHRHDMAVVNQLAKRVEKLESMLEGDTEIRTAGRIEPAAGSGRIRDTAAGRAEKKEAEGVRNESEVRVLEGTLELESSEPSPEKAKVESISVISELTETKADSSGEKKGSGADDKAQVNDLEAFWSDFLEEMQSFHFPTYSLLSQQSFPLEFSGDVCTLGVSTEHIQTTLERRIDKVEAVLKRMHDRPVRARFKIAEAGPRKPVPARDSRGARQKGSKSQDASEEGERSETRQELKFEAEPVKNGNGAEGDGNGAPRVYSGKTANTRASDSAGDGGSTTIREAYKLFEGPGSRLIG